MEIDCKHERVEACLFTEGRWWKICLSCGKIEVANVTWHDIERNPNIPSWAIKP